MGVWLIKEGMKRARGGFVKAISFQGHQVLFLIWV
jgi:hypothetical protein